ncbi:MAG: NfeD family protein [Bdellovibrio sp.]
MMGLDISLWNWLILAALLASLELLSTNFFLIFFSGGAIVAALADFLGAGSFIEIMTFSLSSLIFVLVFRKRLMRFRNQNKAPANDIGSHFVLSAPLSARGQGSVDYQGSPWTAVNLSERDLPKGTSVVIEKTEGIKILVKPSP